MDDLKVGLLLSDYLRTCSKRRTVELDILAVRNSLAVKKSVGCCCMYRRTFL